MTARCRFPFRREAVFLRWYSFCMKKRAIVLHHSAILREREQFWTINNYHKRKGFPESTLGLFGGYHYLINGDGLLWQYRKENEHGAHTNTKWDGEHLNDIGIGICVGGDFTRQDPAEVQLQILTQLLRYLQFQHAIPDSAVLLHRDVSRTLCPGRDLRHDSFFRRDN